MYLKRAFERERERKRERERERERQREKEREKERDIERKKYYIFEKIIYNRGCMTLSKSVKSKV